MSQVFGTTLTKRKRNFSEGNSYVIGCKVIYEEGRKYLTIYEEAVSHI
jgi:hypothetical protein